MSNDYNIFEEATQEMSIEEFDKITEGKEKHVFSNKYNRRKEKQLKAYRKEKLGVITGRFVKVAVAAATFIIVTPLAANAATNGELFQRLWGNAGKQNIESHDETFVEEGKVDNEGNTNEVTVTMPEVEYVEVDEEKAQELIGDNVSTEPTVIQMGDTTMTVLSTTRDNNSVVVEYTLEKEGGVDCFNYSEFDNEAKGAWINDDQELNFAFEEGAGKIYVDLEKSTEDKLYCYEYITTNSDQLTFWYREYTKPRSEVLAILDEDPHVDLDAYEAQFVKEENEVEIPLKEKIASVNYANADGGLIEISPISMRVIGAAGLLDSELEEGWEIIDFIGSIKITYKDGTEYLVYSSTYMNEQEEVIEPDKEVESCAYICGNGSEMTAIFNRLVDTDQIEKITINDTDYTN